MNGEWVVSGPVDEIIPGATVSVISSDGAVHEVLLDHIEKVFGELSIVGYPVLCDVCGLRPASVRIDPLVECRICAHQYEEPWEW